MSSSSRPTYRPDIDGLRAIAVLSVIGFHFFGIQAGFVGVDIFFVISGYLISSILFKQLQNGQINLFEFYEHRIKRIFPALLTILLFCFVLGWFLLLATEFEQLNKHIAAGLTFTSNLVLYAESGYFDADSHTKILLHLWSLGVEEQFYIVWPLLLMAWWRYRHNFLFLLIPILLASFALNIVLIKSYPSAAFYLPITRFWELLVGAFLAYRTTIEGKSFLLFNSSNFTSLIGLFLLIICNVLVNDRSSFPGWWALLPTLGSALLIAAGNGAWFNHKVLSSRLMIWIGVISYPVYLWHWPLLAYARIAGGGKQSPSGIRIAMFFLAFLLAWLTYRFIEKPIRFGKPVRIKVVGLIAVALVLLCCSLYVWMEKGMPSRAANQLKVLNEGDTGQDDFAKHLSILTNIRGIDDCEIAVVGDSYGSMLVTGLAETLPKKRFCSLGIGQSLPFMSMKDAQQSFNTVISSPKIKTVILSAYWNIKKPLIPEGRNYSKEIIETANKLHAADKQVIVIAGIPNFSFYPTKCKYDWPFLREQQCSEKDFFQKQYLQYKSDFNLAKDNSKITLIDLNEVFCGGNQCSMAKDGLLLFRDEIHLNINGSRLVANPIVDQLQ